jgi:hypothetical protein
MGGAEKGPPSDSKGTALIREGSKGTSTYPWTGTGQKPGAVPEPADSRAPSRADGVDQTLTRPCCDPKFACVLAEKCAALLRVAAWPTPLFGEPPDFVADLLGDHSVVDMEVV